jgi:photosystem II stability/assembly factor-like uncharacterized protein
MTPVGYPIASGEEQIGFVAIDTSKRPGQPTVWLSSDGGQTWTHARPARDSRGRPVALYDVGLSPQGALIVTGNDDAGQPGVWLGTSDVGSFQHLRRVLFEHVTLTRAPLDRPQAIWATAPQAIWESDDGGLTWFLFVSHLTWSDVQALPRLTSVGRSPKQRRQGLADQDSRGVEGVSGITRTRAMRRPSSSLTDSR